jgi:hypothetical protein
MIQITEYRIGNYILSNGAICPVTFLNDDDVFSGTPGVGFLKGNETVFETCDSAHVEPVPLTDALLERLAYAFHPHFKLWQHEKNPATFTIELDRDYTAMDFSHRPVVKNIRYLHTLQNLHFLLSGEELQLAATAMALPAQTA